jgi:hypothetical protein
MRLPCWIGWLAIGLWAAAWVGAAAPAAPAAVPAVAENTVRIVRTGANWRLERNGQPFFVQGAVGTYRLDWLKASGANAVRTHPRSLDAAQGVGLHCLIALPLGLPRRGFDYTDSAQTDAQFEQVRALVRQYRHHPALLLWNLGNEPEIQTTKAQRVPLWREVNRLATMVKAEDPAHPVITVIGDAYRRILHELEVHCPALDAIGLNAYQDMLTLPEDVAREGWQRPYLVTEFGPQGHWQVPKTAWRVPIEPTSTEKSAFYERAYRAAVKDQSQCLGSFAFYWDHKQEKTHTWYGMFLPDGSRTAAVDTMQYLWTGAWPSNRCPRIGRIRCLAAPADRQTEPPVLGAAQAIEFAVDAEDPEGDRLKVTWDFRREVADNPNVGGDYEPASPALEGVLQAGREDGRFVTARMPLQPGKHRLFAYAHDLQGGAATANLPVLVVQAH